MPYKKFKSQKGSNGVDTTVANPIRKFSNEPVAALLWLRFAVSKFQMLASSRNISQPGNRAQVVK